MIEQPKWKKNAERFGFLLRDLGNGYCVVRLMDSGDEVEIEKRRIILPR